MAEASDEILKHIEAQRAVLSQDIDTLHHRVREATDWRVQFYRHPMVLMGVAALGGLLLSTLMPRR